MSKFIFLIFAFFISCSSSVSTTHFKGCAMTMKYHVVIGQKLSKKQQKKVSSAIEKIFQQTDHIYNNWNPSSEISQINQNKSQKQQAISSELRDLLLCCDKCYKITKKRFDPTIGSIFNAWKNALIKKQLPSSFDRDAVGWDNIILDELSLQKKHPKCQLDLCGISKGYTIDLLVKKLLDLGYNDFFVEWGGEIFAKGLHPKKRKWSVLINGLLENKNNKIYLKNEAVATSGNFMLCEWIADGKSYFHIFDPKSKKPLEKKTITSISIIAADCYLADAIATAAMTFTDIDKLKKWGNKIIKNNPDVSLLIINSKDHTTERIFK